MKRILITNDDGATAPGLARLIEVLSPLARVTVVAPEHNRFASRAKGRTFTQSTEPRPTVCTWH